MARKCLMVNGSKLVDIAKRTRHEVELACAEPIGARGLLSELLRVLSYRDKTYPWTNRMFWGRENAVWGSLEVEKGIINQGFSGLPEGETFTLPFFSLVEWIYNASALILKS
eukprot:419654-Pelagomonas_calceolata.AAC.9